MFALMMGVRYQYKISLHFLLSDLNRTITLNVLLIDLNRRKYQFVSAIAINAPLVNKYNKQSRTGNKIARNQEINSASYRDTIYYDRFAPGLGQTVMQSKNIKNANMSVYT